MRTHATHRPKTDDSKATERPISVFIYPKSFEILPRKRYSFDERLDITRTNMSARAEMDIPTGAGAAIRARNGWLAGAGRAVDVEMAERDFMGEPGTDAPLNPDDLAVADFNFELERNRSYHHTSKYEIKHLFVRRGQDFDIDVTFSKVPKTETLSLELKVRGAKVSSVNKGTIIQLPFSRSTEVPGDWGIRVGSVEGAKYSLVVKCPANAIVGRYDVAVVISESADAELRYFRQKEPLYVLFNAWCSEDQVFMSGEDEKDEYVLNDEGYVFTGSARPGGQYARAWVFGQFEDTVTDVIFDILEKHVRENARRDPIIVSRKLTGLINYMPVEGHPETETGILVGNWSGDYEGGKKPSAWLGSTKIYETYAASGGEPVKFGQCWVFSGVLNTAMRCLGIPSRSVTNFASAHDTDASMTIDSVVDEEDGDEVPYLNDDSVWNFHVWNEVWMSRPDLIPGMGGWQVVDATPQETSEGIFQTGPAPVTAIKQGLTYLNYDTKFAFAEVNADRVTWTVSRKRRGAPDMKVVRVDKNSVGKYISTKKVAQGNRTLYSWNARQDITLEYKYPEGSDQERMAVERAVSFGTRPNPYRNDEKADDVEIKINLAEKISVGEDFDIKLYVNNKSSVERNIDVIVNAHICFYTGVLATKLPVEKGSLTVAPGVSEHVLGTIRASMYAEKLVDQTSMKFYIFGKVRETSQQVLCQDCVFLTPPDLQASVKVEGHEVEVIAEFTNPLPIPLTDCCIAFEGARLVRNVTLYPNDVPANGTFKQRMKFAPRTKGMKTLVIDFDSKQLANVMAVVEVNIP